MITPVRPEIFGKQMKLIAAMSTRAGGVSPEPLGLNLSYSVGDDEQNVDQNRKMFFGALGIQPGSVAFTRQIHGDSVVEVHSPGTYPSCDALMTNVPGVYLAISIADCVPILLFDHSAGCIAAVHAGWRGSRARIVQRAMKLMTTRFGSNPKSVAAWVGPAAGACCYEVGDDVALQFDQEYAVEQPSGKLHLDLQQFNGDLLRQEGVREENLEISTDCTIHQHQYHSYRRDRERSGRMLAVIGMIS